MSAQLEKIVKTYKRLAQIPAITGAKILNKGTVITSSWSQRNIERGKNMKFSQAHVLTPTFDKITDTLPVDVSNELLTVVSPSEHFKAVLRELDSKQYLEIWLNSNLTRNVDLGALDVHGNVYTDGEFSTFAFSPDESKVLYVAEKKPPKTEPFLKRKAPKKESNDGGTGDDVIKGEEYLFKQDWGEQLVGKKQSVIVQYDIESDTVEILEGIPEDICIAQPVYSPDGSYIVGIAYKTTPRKLGLIYCSNRISSIFKLDFQGNYEEIISGDISVKSLRFTPDGQTLIWLQRSAGGPHAAALALLKTSLPLVQNPSVEVVIDIVRTDIPTTSGVPFYGIYNPSLLKNCWASERRLVLSTNQKASIKTYIIDIDSKAITELEYVQGSMIALDVVDDIIVVSRRNFLTPDQLVIARVPAKGQEQSIEFKEITQPTEIDGFSNFTFHYLDLTSPESSESFRTFNIIYLGPQTGAEKEVPLIIFPHGGPHSAFANNLSLECSMYLSLGYAIILINYRGSIGAGQDSVEFLLGKIGKTDVSDCIQATKQAYIQYPWVDPNRTVLVGGSHGGFLVTHLSGQYPDMFKAVVARNPVIDVAIGSITSDIPDWAFVELGSEYSQVGEPDSEIFLKMRQASPIQHAHKVKAPTLLQVGSKDLRVPCSQAMEYYHRLKANGIPVRMNLYDDNHPLGSVPNEVDNVINCLLWLHNSLYGEK